MSTTLADLTSAYIVMPSTAERFDRDRSLANHDANRPGHDGDEPSTEAKESNGRRFHPLDLADDVRDQGVNASDVYDLALREGLDVADVAQAIVHHATPCPHSALGDIGTLPMFPRTRPPFNAADRDIRAAAREAWSAVNLANNPVQFLNLGGVACWVKASSDATATTETLDNNRMWHLMGRVCESYKPTQKGDIPCRPPREVANHMVADPHPPLPRLRRLVHVPVFDKEGRLCASPGFHSESRLFVAPQGLVVPRVKHAPSPEDVDRAKDLILNELLGDFPFLDTSDRTAAVALLLLPFVRDLIDGPTPLHLVTKTQPGVGGTLLVETLCVPALGKDPGMQPMPTGEAEVQRRITADLLKGSGVVVFDNIPRDRVLDSGQLASALTAAEWEDRQIRTSTLLTLPITNTWIATGNDVRVSDEIARRVLPIRLRATQDNPFDRTGFHHADLKQWTKKHRGDLVWSALTLSQRWVAAGMPNGSLTLGKYERWAAVLSGITETVGLPDLGVNRKAWMDGRKSDERDLQEMIGLWFSAFGEREVKAGKLLPVIGHALNIDRDGGKSAETTLGTRLGGLAGRTVGGYEVCGRQVSGSMSWCLRAQSG
jgi:putative DNA primase/helicase